VVFDAHNELKKPGSDKIGGDLDTPTYGFLVARHDRLDLTARAANLLNRSTCRKQKMLPAWLIQEAGELEAVEGDLSLDRLLRGLEQPLAHAQFRDGPKGGFVRIGEVTPGRVELSDLPDKKVKEAYVNVQIGRSVRSQ
jgi:hypothetical protein